MDADKAYFDSIPWCAQLLADPKIIIEPMESRVYKVSTEDAIFAETLKTPNTIKAGITFYNRPCFDSGRINQLNALISLGYGVNGYPRIAHGGVVAMLIDETMGLLLHVNKLRGSIPSVGSTVTAYLNITYVKAVATPQIVLVSALFKEVAGRKNFVQATVKDGCGEVLAKAEALWIGVNRSGEKL